MPSWTQRQTLAIDLNQAPAERYSALPDEAIAQAKSLLGEVLKDVPGDLNYLADMVRLRTGNRFHPEALAIADRADTHWRSIMIANISYDLMLAVLGCSTIAMATPAMAASSKPARIAARRVSVDLMNSGSSNPPSSHGIQRPKAVKMSGAAMSATVAIWSVCSPLKRLGPRFLSAVTKPTRFSPVSRP